MIARPYSLAYQSFEIAAVDYEQILSAYASDGGLIPQLDIDVDSVVAYGSAAPVVTADLRRAAVRTQRHALTSARYAQNVAYKQTVAAEVQSRLECPVLAPPPLNQLSLHEAELVVLDAGVGLRQSETGVVLEACDYPPFLARPSDPRVVLHLSQMEAQRLVADPAWVDGWNPFVRVLARYSGLESGGRALDVLMLSTRRARPTDHEGLNDEWASLRAAAFAIQTNIEDDLDFKLVPPPTIPISADEFRQGMSSTKLSALEAVARFENDIFEAGWAFWLGAYYHRRSLPGQGQDGVPAPSLVHPFDKESWIRAALFLKRLDLARFDPDVMRRIGVLKKS